MQEHLVSKLIDDFERGKISRRQLIENLILGALGAAFNGVALPALAENKGFNALAVDHISYEVADYAKTRDFYVSLLGLKVAADTGTQCRLSLNGSKTYVLARNAPSGVTPPRIDHIAYTISTWDTNGVKAELQRRGLDPQPTRHGPFDANPSFYVKDPDGFEVQISASGITG
jgi:glyoxylase I family protein